MRLVFSSQETGSIEQFTRLLDEAEIPFSLETKEEKDWGNDNYGITIFSVWIHDDDDIERAKELIPETVSLTSSSRSPPPRSSPPNLDFLQKKFKISSQKEPKTPAAIWSLSIFLLCILLFSFDNYQHKKSDSLPPEKATPTAFSPIRKAFFIDYPDAIASHDAYLEQQGAEPKEGFYWAGVYTYLIIKLINIPMSPTPSIESSFFFERIREGEVWRLISPCLLHGDLIHLLFNMLWLIFLGTQIENRLSTWRFLSLITIFAIVSNSAQYAMTGPNFLGFSGVICGMLGFIHSRQRKAPWEAYSFTSATYTFISFFIWSLVAISVLTFFLEWYLHTRLYFGFANTAHVSGLFTGLWLGRQSWFKTIPK